MPLSQRGCRYAYLNAQLQAALNPPDKHKAELVTMGRTLREGDRVMQIKNNYDVPWFKKKRRQRCRGV